ncbi:MAG TPA: ATP-binding cassette domain-containing protein [Devosia sp.]|nr:ATP-binding cassette domain-containing protein [Devosia sp.]
MTAQINKTGAGAGLVLENIEIFHGSAPLLCLDAEILPGQVLTLMGPSGSGKSTLVSAISGFLPRAFTCKGRILLGGNDITILPPDQRRVGVLFQDTLLFPHFSVLENVLYALPPGGSMQERRREALALLAAVSLRNLAQRDPDTLSGGQKARVALVRVLASRPRALLLDEPFSKLDADLRAAVRQLVFAEVARRALPTLLVTHDRSDADAAGGPILVLDS